ncbi:hypothetical protein [Romeriopsis navalis]|nr:hypothetical protein [Romeriopsis navalis]
MEPVAGQPQASATANAAVAAPQVGTFTADDLFKATGGGCGMTLSQPGKSLYQGGAVFFHGMKDEPALMLLNGQLQKLQRTAASGTEFYGQTTDQTFATQDRAITIQVQVTQGKKGEIESVEIPQGVILMTSQGQTSQIAVVGDAGC